MADHSWRRPHDPALSAPRTQSRVPETVGTCTVCGVTFAGSGEHRALVEEILRVHQSICPGGTRAGHVVTPFE